jgi:hypothetical protein
MADFIQFTGPIKPLGSANFPILSDEFILGGFKIVDDEAARDALDVTTLKVGTLVKCRGSGIYWRAKNVSVGYDEFGDPISSVEWVEFKFNTKADAANLALYQVSHSNFTLNMSNVVDGKSQFIDLNLGCYSCFVLNLRVSQPVKVEIFSRSDYKDINPYTFIARYDHLIDDGTSFVNRIGYGMFELKTSAYSILANEDDVLSKNFYVRITKDKKLTEKGTYSSPLVTVAFDYIPIEL